MPINIRVATASDAPALARLNGAFNGVSDTPEQLAARMLAAGELEIALLAEAGEIVAGFACLRVVPCLLYPEPHAELTELYVAPGQRRRGVARALIAAAEQLAQARGARTIFVATGAQNAAAQGLYRTAGFEMGEALFAKELAHAEQES